MIIGTVVTDSHLSRAKVLAQSIKLHHPEAKVIVSLVERTMNPEAAEFPSFDEVVLAQDTWEGNFEQVIFKYNAWEACCFAKGSLFHYIFNKYASENHVLYLDSDMEVVAPLDDLMKQFERSSVLLSPQHLRIGAEYDDFKYGVFNAGLIGASRTPDGLEFVKWWMKRLERHSYFEENDKLFEDQKWLNLVPTFFNGVEIIEHPGYNVAAWNYSEQQITRSDSGQYLVNGEPLYVLHFHGINDRENEVRNPGYGAMHPDLSRLIKEYAAKLDMIGRSRTERIPWSYQFFINEEPIHRKSRLVYRNNILLENKYPNPFLLSNEFFKDYAPEAELAISIKPRSLSHYRKRKKPIRHRLNAKKLQGLDLSRRKHRSSHRFGVRRNSAPTKRSKAGAQNAQATKIKLWEQTRNPLALRPNRYPKVWLNPTVLNKRAGMV